jgi:hypothetical protein
MRIKGYQEIPREEERSTLLDVLGANPFRTEKRTLFPLRTWRQVSGKGKGEGEENLGSEIPHTCPLLNLFASFFVLLLFSSSPRDERAITFE